MKPRISLRQSLQDPNLLGGALTGESWAAWRTLLVASMGESLTEDERATFRALTGRDREPLQRVDQFAAVIGRRGGKSRAMATLACYLAGLCEHTDALVPGERGVLLCVALDQRVAKIILDYAEASFERSPILKQLIASRTADALELTNGITLEVRPASFRKLRGPTYVAVIADELAFWYVDAAYANPDVEILNAVEPGLATTGGPLILASSPHARRGGCGKCSSVITAQVAIRSSSWLTARPGPSILHCRSAWSIARWRRTAPARRRSISPSSAPMSRASSRSRWSRVASVTIARCCRQRASPIAPSSTRLVTARTP